MDEGISLRELAERISNGDQHAEGVLYARLRPAVLTMLRVRSRDAEIAQDLTQDTFRILIERLRSDGIDDPERLSGFVQGIARNLYRDYAKKEARRGTDADTDQVELAVSHDGSALDEIQHTELSTALTEMLNELSQPRDREILKRTFLDQQDKQVVCAQLDISVDHFHRVIYRAKQRFADLVRKRRPDLLAPEYKS